jgi:hypothetical protein
MPTSTDQPAIPVMEKPCILPFARARLAGY